MTNGFLHSLLIACAILMVSCGAKVNTKRSLASEYSYLMIEKQCASNKVSMEPITADIAALYTEFQKNYPLSFKIIPTRLYDYKNPLVVNLVELKKDFMKIKKQAADPSYVEGHTTAMAIEIFYMFQNVMRFEGQKCSFPQLVTKKFQDIRPYMDMKDFCIDKDGNEICSINTIAKLNPLESTMVEEKTIKMCKAFDQKVGSCEQQFTISKRNNTVTKIVNYYQKRFQEERYNKLFMLRDSHLKFQCENVMDVTEMTVKVLDQHWGGDTLRKLTDAVAEAWTKNNFQLNIELVDRAGSDVIEIFPAKGGISYVPDNNNRQVYLSQELNLQMMKRVLAHEFGHVLGFPDCYTEFFDNKKQDLVYYEIGNDDTNIMCSLKAGVSVPDNYLNQLSQNSCVFN